jgi:hypothetical protein
MEEVQKPSNRLLYTIVKPLESNHISPDEINSIAQSLKQVVSLFAEFTAVAREGSLMVRY